MQQMVKITTIKIYSLDFPFLTQVLKKGVLLPEKEYTIPRAVACV